MLGKLPSQPRRPPPSRAPSSIPGLPRLDLSVAFNTADPLPPHLGGLYGFPPLPWSPFLCLHCQLLSAPESQHRRDPEPSLMAALPLLVCMVTGTSLPALNSIYTGHPTLEELLLRP